MSAGEIGEVGPVGTAIVAWIAAGWILINVPLDGSMNLVVGGGLVLFGLASLAGLQ